MKKTIALLLALVMCLSQCACGGGNEAPETPPNAENITSTHNKETEAFDIGRDILGEWFVVNSPSSSSLMFNEDGTGFYTQNDEETTLTWKYDNELNCYTVAMGVVFSATIENTDGIEQLILGDAYCVRFEYYADAHEDYLASITEQEIPPTMDGPTAEANKPTKENEEEVEALYTPYIGKWVCSDDYYVIVNEDGTIVYNDAEYTPEYIVYGDGVAAVLYDAPYTYQGGTETVTAKGCVFVWGLTERFGEGVMVGDHDGRHFILQTE